MKTSFYIIGALLIVGSNAVPVLLSQSFQGNNFPLLDGWTVVNGYPMRNTCSGTIIFGGHKSIGKDCALVKVFQTPPHSQIQIKLQFWKILSWDDEEFHLWVDDQRIFAKSFPLRQTKSLCGIGNMDEVLNIDVTFKHTGTSAIVVMTSTLNEAWDNESWGIREFQILVEKCPDGCSACIAGESAEQCRIWEVAKNFWTAIIHYEIEAEGWSVAGAPSSSTYCGGVSLFGGYNRWGRGAEIKGVSQLKPHYRLKTKFIFAKVDSWENQIASFKIDGQEVWESSFSAQQGYHTSLCHQQPYRQLFTRVEVEIEHAAEKVEFQLSTTLNKAGYDASWGVRDFFVFIAQCPAYCNKCTVATDCLECAPNYTLKGGLCFEIFNFLVVEQSFFDNVFAGLNNWVLKGNKQGRLVYECGGKYIVGGYNVLGKGGIAEKNFKLPGHKRVRIQMNLYKIDSWDNEFMFIKIDGVEVWKQQWTIQTGGANICGQRVWNDHIQYVEQTFTHSSPNLNLQITSNLDEDPEFESWGFRDFKLFIEPREECAVLFTQANFEGTSFSLCSSTANFAEERIPSQIKSVKVPPQGKVTLYSNNDYFGKKFIIIEDIPEINEEVYSFAEVEKRWIETQEI